MRLLRVCISNCPKGIIGRVPRSAKVYIACSNHGKGEGSYRAVHPRLYRLRAVREKLPRRRHRDENSLPEIDYGKCVGCGKCAAVCPRKCIAKM